MAGTRLITVKIAEIIVEALDAIARCEGRSRSEVIREAIIKYLVEKCGGPAKCIAVCGEPAAIPKRPPKTVRVG